jgi:hypothetical protein
VLVLQGGRDFQVSPLHDFTVFKEALVDVKGAQCKLYPLATHLFIDGTGRASMAEYEKTAHVNQAVVDDISAFVNASPTQKS